MKKSFILILALVVMALTAYFYFKPMPLIENTDNASILFVGFNPGTAQTNEITNYNKEEVLTFLNTCKKRRVLQHTTTGHQSYPLDIIIIMNGDNPTIQLGRYCNDIQSNGKHYKMVDEKVVLGKLHEILGLTECDELSTAPVYYFQLASTLTIPECASNIIISKGA